MAPRAKVRREDIADAAFRLVRREGIAKLTAKALAAEAGCSTQPVFWYFSGMEEVVKEVTARAKAMFAESLRKKRDGVNPFKTVGLNYIYFAKEESEIFKMLYMSGNAGDGLMNDENVPFAVDVIVKEQGLSKENALRVFRELWLFSHGIATMIATGKSDFSDDDTELMLTDVYTGVLMKIRSEKV